MRPSFTACLPSIPCDCTPSAHTVTSNANMRYCACNELFIPQAIFIFVHFPQFQKMPNIVVAAICFALIIVVLVVVLIVQAVRHASYSRLPTKDVEEGLTELIITAKPVEIPEPIVTVVVEDPAAPAEVVVPREDNIAERTEEVYDDSGPDGVVYPVGSDADVIPQAFARLSNSQKVGDWKVIPFNRRAGFADPFQIAKQKTPFGRFPLGRQIECPIPFSSTFQAFEFTPELWIVYGADLVGKQHALERHFLWCTLLSLTGIPPVVHLLSGEAPYSSIAGEMKDRFVIMKNVGRSFKDIFAHTDLPRNVELVRATIRCLRGLHKLGVVNGNVNSSTVFAQGNMDLVHIADFSRAEAIGATAKTQPWEDVWAAIQMLPAAIGPTTGDERDNGKQSATAAYHVVSALAKQAATPPYDEILEYLGNAIW